MLPARCCNLTSAATLNPLEEDETNAKAGLDSIAAENKLGALLIQFPISFKNAGENRDYLQKLIKRFREYPLVVEVRHATWDDPEILAHFGAQSVASATSTSHGSAAAVRSTEHATAPVAYVRLHEPWKEKIERLGEKAEKTFVVTNNHYKRKAAVNDIELKKMLNGKKVTAPATLIENYPELHDFAEEG